jgi:phage tail-like protein
VPRPDPDPALSIRFDVQVDGVELGSFTGCDGLTAEYEVFEYAEGGNNAFVHRFPGRVKYGNVTLTRAVDRSSGALAGWFTSLAQEVQHKTAVVTAFDGNRQPIARWSLTGVWPVKYSGPTLASDGSGAAVESLELAHDGFQLS